MSPDNAVDVVLQTLQFHAFLATLIFGAQGFIVGRLLSAQGGSRTASMILLGIAFGLAAYGVFELAERYLDLMEKLTSHQIPIFVENWLEQYWQPYILLLLTFIGTGLSAALTPRSGGDH